jgi:creatinine amidohydrolase/Fe(II)-dependent formamide hydrolase-like protein
MGAEYLKSADDTQARRDAGRGEDELESLRVLDRLEVGPVVVERRRLVAPYTVSGKSGGDSKELIYHYDENVFEPGDVASENLCSMIAAQVAINYGLFCKSISFNGVFDEADRRFIRRMLESTAREILVKKFLEPNPFLVGDAARFPPVKAKRYCRAAVEFGGAPEAGATFKWRLWQTDGNKHAILSSGGKDSLLSFALIDELGSDVHPIFVNESGRHWFTALNAFNHFKANVPNTARVWTNSDRVFAWMLRRLPFVRKDFQDVRSDEYPIRLWTVAVFLFGVLPIMKKRGIARLLVGDEFDTTHRTSYKGITHYDGLYDQSVYFDNSMSRYYMRKGWAMSQFSVLRPLSEMLIEKLLVERYPELLELQTSCHATHKEGDRVRPCGKCEKCRRIVGMLLALDADPGRCGYTKKQVEECLRALERSGVHQEAAGAEHMRFLLSQKGLISSRAGKRSRSKEHREILSLRFDEERSPVDAIPVDLREPLYRIYLEHSNGALRRAGRGWEEADPFGDPAIERSYAFEPAAGSKAGAVDEAGSAASPDGHLWGELNWPDAEERLRKVDVALLPVGSIEQHGPHLPLDTDAFDADYLAKRVAEACSDPKPFVLPLIPYGVSYQHAEFKGTIRVSNEALAGFVYDIGMSAARNGIKKLVIINGHGGNDPALNYAAQKINRDAHIFVAVDTGETSDIDIERIAETTNDVHAGEIETSTSLAVRPHLVRMDRAARMVPRFSSRYLNFSSRRGISWHAYTKRISDTGVMGDPTKANAEKGEKMWRMMIAHLVALVEDLKSMDLAELYHRRY